MDENQELYIKTKTNFLDALDEFRTKKKLLKMEAERGNRERTKQLAREIFLLQEELPALRKAVETATNNCLKANRKRLAYSTKLLITIVLLDALAFPILLHESAKQLLVISLVILCFLYLALHICIQKYKQIKVDAS